MVTYLLSAGYGATQIGIARTQSVAFEVLATWLVPWLMGRIGPIRAGLWLASWQMTCLVGGIAIFWALCNRPTISASGLVGGTILSRVGLRGFNLCSQIIIQEVSHPHAPSDYVLLLLFPCAYISSPVSLSQAAQTDLSMLHIRGRSHLSGIVLRRRSCLAKCIRALFLRLYHYLLAPRPIQVAHAPQRRRSGHCRGSVHGLCLFAAWSLVASRVGGDHTFPEGEATLKGAGARKDHIEQ